MKRPAGWRAIFFASTDPIDPLARLPGAQPGYPRERSPGASMVPVSHNRVWLKYCWSSCICPVCEERIGYTTSSTLRGREEKSMRNLYQAEEQVTQVATKAAVTTAASSSSPAILRDCFELFQATCSGLAKLSIETSNDLFEMDPRVTQEEVYEFRSKRNEWVKTFETSLQELFEKRLAGQRRRGRRPDPLQSFESLRVMNDVDTGKQTALERVTKRLEAAAGRELEALDHRVSVLFGDAPGDVVDNPFSPAYFLDAIGMTSRALYPEARIWRPLMERLVGDFIPAINKTYIQLNRFLAELRILPEIGANLRARSDLRPADDGQLIPLFSRLFNDVHPTLQAWRTLDPYAAGTVDYELVRLSVNPMRPRWRTCPRGHATARWAGFPESMRCW
jgi:hypothetical protein